MFRIIAVSCALVAATSGQFADSGDSKDAKILKEQRFNAGDGRAGAAFATEDGTVFREETDASGNRIGQYSYIDNDGTTFTVKYSAGVDGFRILEGDHIRATGQDAARFDSEFEQEQPASLPLPQEPLPVVRQQQQRPVVRQQQQPRPVQPRPVQPEFNDYEDTPVDPNFNPFINPHDPTHRDFAFNVNGGNFAPKGAAPARSHGASLVPDCADCAGVNPFINPFDASHQQGGVLAGHLAGLGAPIQRAQPAQPRQAFLPVASASPTTPSTPRRFFPPGQLKLNRFETGFNFDFESK